MPFTNLTEAINSWLMGTLTTKNTVLYVVDGNLLNDINAYSVYDIEEVTLIQNAMAQVSGAIQQQQLVLVTTKRKTSHKAGICSAGQLFGTGREAASGAHDPKFSVNLYHQYYLSLYQNRQRLQYGISLNYLRDVYPQAKNDESAYNPPLHIDRFRVQAYLTTQLGNHNTMQLNIGYAPQRMAEKVSTNDPREKTAYTYTNRQPLFMPSLRLHSVILKNLNNDLSVAYVPGVGSTQESLQGFYLYGTDSFKVRNNINSKDRLQQLVIRDHLSYIKNLGAWNLEPSLDIMYKKLKKKNETNSYSVNDNQSGINPVQTSTSFTSYGPVKIYLLTPSLTLFYRNIFNVQAGWLQNLSHRYSDKMKRTFPFVSTSLDVLRTFVPAAKASVKLFASYATGGDFADIQDTLKDFVPVNQPVNAAFPYYGTAYDSAWHMMTAGAVFHAWNNRLMINYSFERRHFNTAMELNLPPNYTRVYMPECRSYTHRLGVQVKIIETLQAQWLSGINATHMKNEIYAPFLIPGAAVKTTAWSGGWVNRLRYKAILLGCDILYYPDAMLMSRTSSNITMNKTNAWLLQNLYGGYQWQRGKLKGLEVYAATRNLAQSDKYDLSDGRRYYGIGFKMCLNKE
ncbi:hypothetical protein A4D02_09130 [Niastella koreensis]|nr:hypothetical protein A4D02_09130 [Niastella koreensis]